MIKMETHFISRRTAMKKAKKGTPVERTELDFGWITELLRVTGKRVHWVGDAVREKFLANVRYRRAWRLAKDLSRQYGSHPWWNGIRISQNEVRHWHLSLEYCTAERPSELEGFPCEIHGVYVTVESGTAAVALAEA
ncbi:MAG TPA: hypothetical protein DIS59_04140, partial [Candidatus Magasanikbacteria bacterium]|nr:hypothetical protein [Candidatus Magasanikbacteria bacterium]